ncbi:MAG TPA: hypothetical protein VKR06_41420 [Ktedonosporobacter sp.]|nr:hypothetical protein [Ktedonosporobacter sp.]
MKRLMLMGGSTLLLSGALLVGIFAHSQTTSAHSITDTPTATATVSTSSASTATVVSTSPIATATVSTITTATATAVITPVATAAASTTPTATASTPVATATASATSTATTSTTPTATATATITPVATATATPPVSGQNKYCMLFLQDLASRLNVTPTALQKDTLAAIEDVLDQKVKDGVLSRMWAARIKYWLESTNHQFCPVPPPHCPLIRDVPHCVIAPWRGGWPLHPVHPAMEKYRMDLKSQIATGLNLSVDQLSIQLQSGKSLSDIASAHQISIGQLQTLVSNSVQNVLGEAIKAGDLPQSVADHIALFQKNHPEMLLHILNAHRM